MAPLRETHNPLPTPAIHSNKKTIILDLRRDLKARRENSAIVRGARGGLWKKKQKTQLCFKVLFRDVVQQARSQTGEKEWNVKRASRQQTR